jgi:hypothetical protein
LTNRTNGPLVVFDFGVPVDGFGSWPAVDVARAVLDLTAAAALDGVGCPPRARRAAAADWRAPACPVRPRDPPALRDAPEPDGARDVERVGDPEVADCDVPADDPVDASVAVPLDGEGEWEPDNGVPVAGIWTGGVGSGGVDGVVTGGVEICGVVIGGVVICGVVICGVVIGPAVIEGTVAVGTVTVGTDTVGTETVGTETVGSEVGAAALEGAAATSSAPHMARTTSGERRTRRRSGQRSPPNLSTNEGLDIAHPTGHPSSSPAGKPDHEGTTSRAARKPGVT